MMEEKKQETMMDKFAKYHEKKQAEYRPFCGGLVLNMGDDDPSGLDPEVFLNGQIYSCSNCSMRFNCPKR